MNKASEILSVVPKVPATLLDFPDAIRAVIDGHQVTKKEWNDEKTVVFMEEHLKIKLPENNYLPNDLIISDGDLLGTDWYIVE